MRVTCAFAVRWRHHRSIGLAAWRIAAGFAAIVAAACAGSHRPSFYPPTSDPCVLVAPPPSPPESIAVALSSAFGGARTTADGFRITQSIETLPGVDCDGRIYRQIARISSSEVVANAGPRVRVRSIDASTARDALDAGVDLLVTDDPAIVSYAAHRDELLTLPLPWDRTYVVLASQSAALDASAPLRLTLVQLLTDAVRADSRIAERPFWWEASNHCPAPVTPRPATRARASSRVVYQSGDRVAEGIAERLVALAGSRSARGDDSVLGALLPTLSQVGARATVAALGPSAFAAALLAADDVAYVLPLPRFTVAPCLELATLLRAAPWLESARSDRGLPVIPLIETRSHALVRRGRVGLSVDADGSLRLLDGASRKNGKP